MRIARCLFLFAVVLGATIAVVAPASAQISVTDEATEETCTDVTLVSHSVSGGCRIHIVTSTETVLIAGTAGGPVVVSSCETEYEGAIGGDGEGYLYDITLTAHEGSPCTRTACDEAGGPQIPWPIHIREAPGGGESLHMVLCLRHILSESGAPGTPCERTIPMTQTSEPHQQDFDGESGVDCTNFPPGAVSFVGHWLTEVDDPEHPEIVVSH